MRVATSKVKPRLLYCKVQWYSDICDVTHKFPARSPVSTDRMKTEAKFITNSVQERHMSLELISCLTTPSQQARQYRSRYRKYRVADKSLARPTSRCILFDGENISLMLALFIYIYIYSTNIPPIMIINRIQKHQNFLSLQLVSFLIGLRIYQYPCIQNIIVSKLGQCNEYSNATKQMPVYSLDYVKAASFQIPVN